jgi:5-methylcytosine-specific restriction endonuclease McrA
MAGIPKRLKEEVWLKYMGNKQEGKCFCCQTRTISTFDFEAGHVTSRKNGGQPVLENLRPICRSCNSSMGDKNLEDFKSEHFPSTGKRASSKKKKSTVNEIDKFDRWLGFR